MDIKYVNEKSVISTSIIFVLDSDEESLNRVFTRKTKYDKPVATETDITVALAEHLLKKLAPGGSYKVDADSKQKRPCLCGCTQEPNYSPTGMGMIIIFYHLNMNVFFYLIS